MKTSIALSLAVFSGAIVFVSPAQATCTIPNTLTNGQPTDATQVMANFNALATCINAAVTAVLIPPQGRLTLTSNTPVMTADAIAQNTIYYTPYNGNQISIAGVVYGFSQMTYSLSTTAHLSGGLYDVFAYNASGTITLCTGPAWTSATARSASIVLSNGIWSNQSSLTCTLSGGGSTASIPAAGATYLGTFYATANGQTGMAFKPSPASGGSNNILALWNAYNRVTVSSLERDSTSTWNYGSATWRAVNASNGNRVTYVDGLGTSFVKASAMEGMVSGNYAQGGVNLDSTSAAPNVQWQFNPGFAQTSVSIEGFAPSFGLHFIQQMESASSGTSTFFGTTHQQALTVELPM